jgi:redox-sensitive bicupin YhaK (pirin superfamily)
MNRKLLSVHQARRSQDGDGVKIYRNAGKHLNVQIDPFLLLDEIKSDEASDYIGGFPEHPHRGFETITYMKTGRMRHRDHLGNEGIIEAGDVQWMTAGRGVLHSEMPEQESGLLHGFQFWLNLPAAEKLKPAAYQELPSEQIPEYPLSAGGLARVVAGKVVIDKEMITGTLPDRTSKPVLIDLQLQANEKTSLEFTADHSALVYVYQGELQQLASQQLGIYSEGDSLQLQAGPNGAELLVFGGKPLREPIAQYGPFVMNTMAEVEQAITDFRDGQLVS